jgi:hypothetical protein
MNDFKEKNTPQNISKEILDEVKIICLMKKVKVKDQIESILLSWVRKVKLNKLKMEGTKK